jgi:DNA-binding response OmpR family regulator
MNQPTIFLIENDDDTRPLFKKVLLEKDYDVLVAVDEQDVLQRVNDGFVKSDLLMVNLVGKSEEEMVSFGNQVRERGQSNIPLIVIAAKYGEDLEGTINQVGENTYIVYLGDGDELFDLLDSLT